MRSGDHAVIGALASAAAIRILGRDRSRPVQIALWCYGVLLSIFVDLDHFLIARRRTGEWNHFRRAALDPVWAFTRQEAVFPDLDMRLERLVSHVLIGGVSVFALRRPSAAFAAFTAIVLFAHVLADLVHEIVSALGR